MFFIKNCLLYRHQEVCATRHGSHNREFLPTCFLRCCDLATCALQQFSFVAMFALEKEFNQLFEHKINMLLKPVRVLLTLVVIRPRSRDKGMVEDRGTLEAQQCTAISLWLCNLRLG